MALKILVVGAGLGGLSAGISCALSGHTVTVVESANELAEVSFGLQITPNASKLLQTWELAEELWQTAAFPTYVAVRRYSDGRILAKEQEFDTKMLTCYGAPFVDIHRADLQRAMYNRAVELGVLVIFGEKVIDVNFDVPAVTTTSGNTYHADLVIGADGIRSRCRECFLQSDNGPKPTGDLAYRIVLELKDIEDPELRDWIENPSVNFWIGPKSHAVGYSLRAGQIYNIVLLVPDNLPPGVARQRGSIEELKSLFHEWDPILNRFLSHVKTVDKWKLMHLEEVQSWVHRKSKFALIGDACHPMLPYLAQGANSSIEDGAVMGALLKEVTQVKQLPHALKLFERLRKSRGEAIAKETFKQRYDFHLENGPEQEARDELFLTQLGGKITGPFPSRWTCPEVQPWLYGYDVWREVESAIKAEPFASD